MTKIVFRLTAILLFLGTCVCAADVFVSAFRVTWPSLVGALSLLLLGSVFWFPAMRDRRMLAACFTGIAILLANGCASAPEPAYVSARVQAEQNNPIGVLLEARIAQREIEMSPDSTPQQKANVKAWAYGVAYRYGLSEGWRRDAARRFAAAWVNDAPIPDNIIGCADFVVAPPDCAGKS